MNSDVSGQTVDEVDVAPPQKVPSRPAFKTFFSPSFKAVRAAAELMEDGTRTPHRRSVLLAGVAAYTAKPVPKLARLAMQLKAADLYRRNCEAIALNVDPATKQLLEAKPDTWGPQHLRDFKKNIYDPLGGSSAVAKLISPKEFKAQLQSTALAHLRAGRLMEIWHFAISEKIAGGETGRLMAIDHGTALAPDLGVLDDDGELQRPVSRTFERAWESCHKSIALAYAASSMRLPNRGTVLDAILENKLTFKVMQPHFEAWLSRAKFVHEVILASLAPSGNRARFIDLSALKVAAQSFPAPHFDRSEAKQICAIYG